MEDIFTAILAYNRLLKKAQDDWFITTASEEGLLNILKLIGLDAPKT